MSRVTEILSAAREAIAQNDWPEVFARLSEADAAEPLEAPDLESLAEAAWWTGRLHECIAARERAFASYTDRGEPRRAAMVALALAKDNYARGASSIGSGWLARAERLLAGEPDSVERGWLHRLRGVIALERDGNYEVALDEARRSHELALRCNDRDLAAVSLHDEGRALLMSGEVEAGMALVEEATAPAVTGELSPFNTAVVYCNTITAFKDLADYGRAGDWSEAAKRWCERQSIAGFPGMCRVSRASVMHLRGAWAEAEVEATRACEELRDFNVSYAAEALYELGEIKLRAGDLDAAEESFRQAHELGREPLPGLALLRLAQGKTEGARACINEALVDDAGDLHRARLLPAQVEIAISVQELDAARSAAADLDEIAQTFGSDALTASAHAARASLALAEDDNRVAVREARQAVRLWQGIDAPYEASQARVLLGEAHLAAGDGDDAALELNAALAGFERLGAVRDVRRVRETLERTNGATARAGGERATRTFMFTDISKSTNLVEAIGDDAWTDLVAWHDKALRSLFAEHSGEEVDHAGDGFLVAFPGTEAACDCAVAIQRSLAEHRRMQGFAPQVRIGLHAAETTRHAAGYIGRGVHEAARISALAEGGEIVASRATAETCPGLVISEPREVTLKGIEAPVEVVSIGWR